MFAALKSWVALRSMLHFHVNCNINAHLEAKLTMRIYKCLIHTNNSCVELCCWNKLTCVRKWYPKIKWNIGLLIIHQWHMCCLMSESFDGRLWILQLNQRRGHSTQLSIGMHIWCGWIAKACLFWVNSGDVDDKSPAGVDTHDVCLCVWLTGPLCCEGAHESQPGDHTTGDHYVI